MLIMAMKMCAMIQLEERQANVEATVANVEGEIAGLKQKMEKTVTMSRVESIARGIAARKIEEMMKNMAESQVISTNVRLFVRA
jgi:hypothetical protein